MEIEGLISALEETISYLRTSGSSPRSSMTVEEMIRRLEAEVGKAKRSVPMDINMLDRLFAPTGVIQETSVYNRWGTAFLRISEIVDEFTR